MTLEPVLLTIEATRKTIDKEVLALWINELRETERERCRYTLVDSQAKCCAVGLLGIVLGVPEIEMIDRATFDQDYVDKIGITYEFLTVVACWNDGNKELGWPEHTFLETAEWLEGKLAG